MKVWFLVHSCSLIIGIQYRRCAIVIVISRWMQFIYIYIYFFLPEIHDQYIGLSKTLSSNHLQEEFPIIDDRSKLCSRSFTCSSSSEKCPLSFSISISYKWYLFVESNYPNCFSSYMTITYTIGCQSVSRILVLSISRNQWFSNRVRYRSGFCRHIDKRN